MIRLTTSSRHLPNAHVVFFGRKKVYLHTTGNKLFDAHFGVAAQYPNNRRFSRDKQLYLFELGERVRAETKLKDVT